MIDGVYCLGFCKDLKSGKVLLIQKEKPDWQAGMLNGLGGKIEKGETPKDAMIREFEEECGVVVENWKHFGHLSDKANEHSVWLYKATADLSGAGQQTEGALHFVDPLVLPENALDSVRWLIPLAFSPQNPHVRIKVSKGG